MPTTTAYLHFSNEEALFGLFSKLDGHKFIDAKGREYRALIEYAPYQKIPRKKVIDKREGTIEKDADFIAFQEKLESELNMKVSTWHHSLQTSCPGIDRWSQLRHGWSAGSRRRRLQRYHPPLILSPPTIVLCWSCVEGPHRIVSRLCYLRKERTGL